MDRRHEVEELARTFLETMKLSLTATVTESDDRVEIDLTGPDAYLMLERKGAVLESLQLLIGKVAETRLGLEKKLVVDCEGYRRGREDRLVSMALAAAETVRKTRRPLELDPLNSYERRIVHLALAEQPGVTTRSEGDGFVKRIVVSPA